MADNSGKPRQENMKARRISSLQERVLCKFFVLVFSMNSNKSLQNRYCCVPLCSQKGTTGPKGEKVGFFSIPTEKCFREQWLHAIRRDTGKHFSIIDSTKVCPLHFKEEEPRYWKVNIRRRSSSICFCMEELA